MASQFHCQSGGRNSAAEAHMPVQSFLFGLATQSPAMAISGEPSEALIAC